MIQVLTVGRSDECDLQLIDSTVSRLHAEIVFSRTRQIFVVDCASSAGTFVGGLESWKRVTQDYLGAGESARFGSYVITVDEIRRFARSLDDAIDTSDLAIGGSSNRVQRNPDNGQVITK